ncbi:hypothetical protein CP552_14140 [Sphingomonas melonis]|jgi:hypothetical protein|nr:hypothetical protein CP552_14140 [Sphingomonas melonis]
MFRTVIGSYPFRGSFRSRWAMERVKMEKALEHLKAALAIIDAEGNALAAAKLCQVIELVQVSSAAASEPS